MHEKVLAIGLIALLAAAGCGSGPGDDGASSPAEGARDEAAPVAVTEGPPGTVAGVVRLDGDPPERERIDVSSDSYCAMRHGDNPPMSETVVTNPDGTLRNVFVYVKEGVPEGAAFPIPDDPVVLDQRGCTYRPHVFGIMVGQPLTIHNSDPTLHNVRSLAKKNRPFNIGMPGENTEVTRTFTEAEVMVKIKCDVHPWMSSYCGVLDHPFYDVTGDSGTFELKDAPAGTYTIEAWHEEFGTQTRSVTVTPGQTTEVNFTFRATG